MPILPQRGCGYRPARGYRERSMDASAVGGTDHGHGKASTARTVLDSDGDRCRHHQYPGLTGGPVERPEAGRVIGSNPQSPHGSDIMSRLVAIRDEPGTAGAILESMDEALQSALERLCGSAGLALSQIDEVRIVGNSAMLSILGAMDPVNLLETGCWGRKYGTDEIKDGPSSHPSMMDTARCFDHAAPGRVHRLRPHRRCGRQRVDRGPRAEPAHRSGPITISAFTMGSTPSSLPAREGRHWKGRASDAARSPTDGPPPERSPFRTGRSISPPMKEVSLTDFAVLH